MRLFGYLLIACMSISVATQAGVTRLEGHLHLTHPHSASAHDHDHEQEHDHVEVSDTSDSEYEHQHSPDGPVHHHESETTTVAQAVILPSPAYSVGFVLPVHSTIIFSNQSELASLETCPPRRPPRT